MFKGISTRFNDWGVSLKLTVGFGALVFLTVLVGAVSLIATNLEDQALEEVLAANEAVFLTEEIEVELLQARRREKDFLLRYEEQGFDQAYENYIVQNIEHTNQILELVEEVRALVPLDSPTYETDIADLDQIVVDVGVYRQLLDQQVADITNRGFADTGLEGSWRDNASAIEDGISGIPTLEVLLLQMRRHEKDYLLRGELEDAATTREFNAQLQRAIQFDDSLSSNEKTRLVNETEAYIADFDALVELDAKIAEDRDTFRAAAQDVFPLVDELIADEQAAAASALATFNRLENIAAAVEIALLVLSVALGALLATVIARSLIRQTDALTALFRSIGIGEFGARAEVYSNDELGQATGGVNSMLDRLLEILNDTEAERAELETQVQRLVEDVSELASGDLTITAEASEEAATRAIADALNFAIGELRGLVGNVEESAAEVATTSSWMSQIVDDMVSQTANSAQVAEQAADSARQGGEAVDSTIAAMARIRENTQETARRMKRLGEVTQEISEAVQLIEELSDRTTVLALNASIQAAAAGDAGRGFAVVADEVQRLAERATGATRQIEDLVKSIQSETNEAVVGVEEATREVVEGSQLAQSAGERMSELNELVAGLASLIDDVSSRTALQTQNSLITLSNLSTDLQTSVSAFRATDAVTAGNGNGSGNGAVQTS